jgi:hypothetical protein
MAISMYVSWVNGLGRGMRLGNEVGEWGDGAICMDLVRFLR